MTPRLSIPSAPEAARLPAFLLLAVLLGLDLTACRLSYWTLGDIWSGLYIFATLPMFLLIFALRWFPRAASLAGLVLSLSLVIPQFWLANQWLQATREASSLAVEACEARSPAGRYPDQLPPRYTSGGTEIRYSAQPDGSRMAVSFSFTYGTGHSLSSPSGTWFWESD